MICAVEGHRDQPALLTGCLLRVANRGVPPCLSQIVLLDVALLRVRRPICDKPSGYLRFAALVTKPGEKSGLAVGVTRTGRLRLMRWRIDDGVQLPRTR